MTEPLHGLPAGGEPTARDVLQVLSGRHHSDGRRDCGAKTEEQPCSYSPRRPPSRHPYHCTEEPGHDGLHQDALHCWSFERFGDSIVVRYAPRDLARCLGCGHSWPCPESRTLRALAQELGVELDTP